MSKIKLNPIKPVMVTVQKKVFAGRIVKQRRVLIDFRRHVNKPQGRKS